MVIWRGWGLLVPVVLFAAFVLAQLGADAAFGEGYYKANDWPKYTALGTSSVLIALLGYLFNIRWRGVVEDPETGETRTAPAHSLFFVPIEYWSVIIPIAGFWLSTSIAETDARELAMIQDPAVGDVYSVDFRELYEDADGEYPYGLLKVVGLSPEGVEVVASQYVYDRRAGVRKALREGEAADPEFFLEDAFVLEGPLLLELLESDAIFAVRR